jgi:hypothetical protein
VKVRLAACLLALGLAFPATASAIEGQRAVRHIKLYVQQDCHSYPGFRCVGWHVEHCYEISRRKVRCRAIQEFRHNGNWRQCVSGVAAVEWPDHSYVELHFGYTRCYSESGEEIR